MTAALLARIRPVLLASVAGALFSTGLAAETVRVGVALFPPYIAKQPSGDGLRMELLELLNKFQDRYRFEAVLTGAVRRFKDFEQGKYDLSFYDSLDWGWQGQAVDVSEPYLSGAEVYVALAQADRDERYFAQLTGKRMIGVLGYHYGFAQFNSEPSYLRKYFGMVLTDTNEATLRLLLAGRGDIAVVTEAYLCEYLQQYPELRPRLLVSQRKDQVYAHTVVVRKGSRPSAEEMNQLFRQMRKAGALDELWKKYGGLDGAGC